MDPITTRVEAATGGVLQKRCFNSQGKYEISVYRDLGKNKTPRSRHWFYTCRDIGNIQKLNIKKSK